MNCNTTHYRANSSSVPGDPTLLLVFSLAALALAAIGIYGVLSYAVAQRTREIGIRIALGANRGDVLEMILGRSARLAFAGLAIGLAVSAWATRLLSGILFQVGPRDVVTLLAVSIFFFLVSLGASYIPARRAANVDPCVALKNE